MDPTGLVRSKELQVVHDFRGSIWVVGTGSAVAVSNLVEIIVSHMNSILIPNSLSPSVRPATDLECFQVHNYLRAES